MTPRFRYLPCALHPALSIPWWSRALIQPSGPNGFTAPFVKLWADHQPHVDLTFDAGWDHAVRALAAIRGITCEESMTYHPAAIMEAFADDWPLMRTAQGRREALCRCICAALGVDVDQVFPLEKA